MSDFSLFSLFAAGLVCLAPFTNAYTKPTTGPEGNPIYTPGLNDVVPVNQEYGITWQPTTEGTVTLVLLKGPADNLEVLYPLVEKLANNGNFFWTPSDKLAPGDTGYGIQLIDDATGQYQWSTQFGISNPGYTGSASSEAPSYGSSSSESGSATPSGYASSTSSASPTGYAHPTGGYAHPTGSWGHSNGTTTKPTYHHTQPTLHTTKAPVTTSSYVAPPSASAPPPPKVTGGASSVATSFFGLVAAAGIAVFAL